MPAGDPVPAHVAALHDGDIAAAFAADGVYWWAAGDDEKAPRTRADGDGLAAAVAADIRADGVVPQARVCVREGPDCMVEGVLVDAATGEPRQTFVQSFQLDPGGAIRRAL